MLFSGQTPETIQCLFPELNGSSSQGSNNPDVVSSVDLPDGTSYQFQYNSYGELARLQLPTGAAYQYIFPEAQSCQSNTGSGVIQVGNYAGYSIYRPIKERDELPDGANISTKMLFSRSYGNADPNHSGRSTTDTEVDYEDGAGNLLRKENHFFYGNPSAPSSIPALPTDYPDWSDGIEYQTVISDASKTWQTVYRTWGQRPCSAPLDQNCWFDPQADASPAHDPQVSQIRTTLDNGLVSQQSFQYDQYNNRTDEQDYDWGSGNPGGVLRHIQTTYVTNSAYTALNLISLPSETKIMDGGSTVYSDTQFGYDEVGMANAGNVFGHDNSTPQVGRGDVTTVKRCLNTADCTWLDTSYVYDIAGNVVTMTDANGHATSYSYADNYSDGQNLYTYAHLTAITNALGQSPYQANYNYGIGKPELVRDWDGQYTTNHYGGTGSGYATDKLVQVDHPNGGYTYYAYPSPTDVVTQRDQNSATDKALKSEIVYDDLGRVKDTRTYESASATTCDSTCISMTKSYDALGNVSHTTNPSRSGDGLDYATDYTYDALGRVKQVKTADGAVTATSYSGNQSTVTDPAEHSRTMTYDGLGRLTSVADATGTTTYTYDPNGNLTRVMQGSETRTFVYDSLNRLVQATNPESGTVHYTYDEVGNLKTKTDPRGDTITYQYDALNRVTNKTYSGPDATPAVTYGYDTLGHLTSVSNGNSSTNFLSFDPMGNVTGSTQVTANQTYGFTYTYDLIGSLTSEAYPSGRVVKTTYNTDEWANAVTGNLNGQQTNYITTVAYWPHGGVHYYVRGNGLEYAASYNSRLQQTESYEAKNNDSGQFLFISCPNWGVNNNAGVYSVCPIANATNDNGDLQSYAEYAGGPGPSTSLTAFTQNFTYDGVDRLMSATDSGGWSRDYCYDAYGNMWVIAYTGVIPLGDTPQEQNGPCPSSTTPFNSNNRITAASYDQAGNQTVVNGDTLTYDAENRTTSAYDPIMHSTETYVYDGNGKRVEKTGPGGSTVYIYDAFGSLAAEYGAVQGNPPCTTCYLSYDHLGTVRLLTDQNDNVVARHDLLPFGEEIPANTAGRNGQWGLTSDVEQKFTGQIRDNETGMDYFGARYYGNALGRFTSADDPFADQDEEFPQSWNLYSYVRNNPLVNIDQSGRSCIMLDDGSQADDGDGQGCAAAGVSPGNPNDESTLNQGQINAQVTAQAPGEPDQGLSWYDSPGQWYTGFVDLTLNNKPSGAARMAYAYLGQLAAPILGVFGEAAEESATLARYMNVLRTAATLKGNFSLGEGTVQEAAELGNAWVGEGATVARDGKTLISADRLRQYRPPSFKPNLGKVQANFESRPTPDGQWQSNGHLDIK